VWTEAIRSQTIGGDSKGCPQVRENRKDCSTFEKTAQAVHQSEITAKAVQQKEYQRRQRQQGLFAAETSMPANGEFNRSFLGA
jgi:hypothetical protein